jgi:hypothetical protein
MGRTFTLSIAAVFFILLSCAKKKNSYATIVCKDVTGNGIDSVTVELYTYVKKTDGTTGTGYLKANGITNETGRISFSFNVPSMYTVKVFKNSQIGTGFIKLEEGKEVQKDITLP